ncbi:MAG: hypothetical protein QM601_10810 [Pseudoxanthomonas sp.]
MKTAYRMLLLGLLGLTTALVGCKKTEDTTAAPAQAAALPAPTNGDDQAWRAYIQDAVGRNMGAVTSTPIMYYLPAQSDPDFQGKYDRLKEQIDTAVQRGVTAGNMVGFGSPESAKMADLVVEAFAKAESASFKGVRVLFIGAAADNDRVKAAVGPSGADYVFVEAK